MTDGQSRASTPPNAAARFVLHAHDNVEAWTSAAALAIAEALSQELLLRPRARMVVCGGRTVPRVYRALAMMSLEWNRVDISLVDERWLPHDDTDTNARLVRDILLHDYASAATFVPLVHSDLSIDEAVAAANASTQPASIGVLSMGDDGHIASLFPEPSNMERIRASREQYTVIDASGCPGARGWHHRISLTPSALARIPQRFLLLIGSRKRELFEQSVADGDRDRWPVLYALCAEDSPLQVHWCA